MLLKLWKVLQSGTDIHSKLLYIGDFSVSIIFHDFCYFFLNSECPICPPSLTIDNGPLDWWDRDADVSLLIGTFKHGYERYNMMRMDPSLCFLSKCGPPDGSAVLAEISADV